MYNKNKVNVNILASRKSGYLSSIMLNGRKSGLMFLSKKIMETGDKNQRLAITFEGNLNCSVEDFIQKIESHPEIHKVEGLSNEDTDAQLMQTLSEDTNTNAKPSTMLNAHNTVDEEAIKLVEQKLSDYLGPIAPFLVQSAKTSCFTVGELVVSLSKELKGEEKESFLSLVDLSNTQYLEIVQNKPSIKPSTNVEPKTPPQDNNSKAVNRSIQLYSHEIITPESLQIAEDKLSKSLGPVATFLIQSAAEKTKHIGDLFLMLSEELNGSEKTEFLGLVNGIDLQKL